MKHRLVGTAVLVALGIIAWPVIFDTTPVREINRRSQIPEAPEVDRFAVPEPGAVQLPPAPDSDALRAQSAAAPPAAEDAPVVADPASAADTSKPAASPPATAAPADDKPVPPARGDAYGLPEQWALQLGVFGDLENAIQVRDRAEKAGYHAILQSVSGKGPTQHRVYIEPKLDKRALERLLPDVQRKLGIKGYVTRYYP